MVCLVILALVGCGTVKESAEGGSGGSASGGNSGGGTPDGGAGVGGGLGVGCVEIVLQSGLAENPRWGLYPLRGGVWRTEGGLHVGWLAGVAVPGDGSVVSRLWIYVATFDPTTGARKHLRRYDVFPSDVTFESGNGNIRGISGSDGETFAASLRSYDIATSTPRNQTLFLGSLVDDSFQRQVDLGWKSDQEDAPDISWDGGAYAVHAKNNATGEISVARVSATGDLLLPASVYGSTPSPAVAYSMSTNPVSGVSYLFDTPGVGRFLSGHDRSGRMLPWAAARPLDLGSETGSSSPGVAAEPQGGAWVTWNQGDATGVVHIAAHVTNAGQVDKRFELRTPDVSGSVIRTPTAVLSESNSRVWLALWALQGTYLYEVEGMTVISPRLVFQNQYFDGTSDTALRVGEMGAVSWQHERWLWFTETFTGSTIGTVLHVVKVQGDCKYGAAYKPPAKS